MRYFKANSELANVLAITFHYGVVYILTENGDSTKFFLTAVLASDGTTRYQYIIKDKDCSGNS